MSSDRESIKSRAREHLRALVGDDTAELRADQWSAIAALLDHRRALVVQRTGWGKSAVYFIATLLLREQGAGPTVIISPLLALMRNQIEAAQQAGIRAVTINSTNAEQWEETHHQIAAGEIDVLLVSPERLNNPGFRDQVLPRLAATCGLLVVDEAHCISDWGHDFRPDYRRIRTLLGELPHGIPVLATTATANARVTGDVAEQLGSDTLVLRGSLDRESLRLGVIDLPGAGQRLGWLAEHLGNLPGSGIIYCLTVAATQEVAQHLTAHGHQVAAYSGQTETTERLALEQQLLRGELKALVATSALGMGFDARLGFVVNLGAPQSPVAYYQQVGRAGRGLGEGAEATVVLLPQREDKDIWAYFASLAFPSEALVRRTLDTLAGHGGALSTAVLETEVDLSRTRLETMLKVLDVDGAVQRVRGGWESTGQEWVYDAERYARVAQARAAEQEAMVDYLGTDACRMRFLREQLDDPEATDCGRCDNCGGLQLPTAVSEQSSDQAAQALARPGVVIAARKMWPTGLDRLGLDLKGKIKDGAAPGRAIARLTDLGHGQALRELFREGAGNQTVPVPLVRAVIEVLGDWQPQVDGLVYVESVRRPILTQDLADGLSRYLQVPILGSFALTESTVQPEEGSANSARRMAAIRQRFTLRAQMPTGASVLLLDDVVATGWTMTAASAELRDAGASAVLPLALATVS